MYRPQKPIGASCSSIKSRLLIELRRTLQEDEDFVLGLQVGHQSRRLLCSQADGPTVPLAYPLFGWLFDSLSSTCFNRVILLELAET